jgi:DNA-binding CsgD family transcriptional regulator
MLLAIDLAYQASLEPGLWAGALAATAASLEASRALILSSPTGGESAMFASESDEPLADTYFAEFKAINPIQEAINGARAGPQRPAYSDRDLLPKSDLVHTAFYDGFMRPADMHSIVLMRLGEPNPATLNIFRSARQPDFERCDVETATRLQRSLHRAWMLGQRLGAQRAVDEALAGFIDRLPGAVLLVGADGRIVHANAAAQPIMAANDGLSASGGVLEATPLPARAQLRRLIARAAAPEADQRSGGAMAVSRPSGRRAFAVDVAPARGEPALAAFRAPMALVCISDPDAQPKLTTRRLRDVFGLTAAESRVALALFEGSSLREAAGELGVSFETVRNQLVHIFQKTGVNRQAALIGLITRAMLAQLD